MTLSLFRGPGFLTALVTFLVFEPYAETWRLLPLAFFVLVVGGVFGLSKSRAALLVTLTLGLPVIGLSFARSFSPELELTHLVLQVVFFLAVSGYYLRGLLEPGPIDSEKLSSAACLYLLAGLTFASIYRVLTLVDANALSEPAESLTGSEIIYFSFVTLTTLGYGDISPVNHLARITAVLEALAGVFYMAIIVARFVSLYDE